MVLLEVIGPFCGSTKLDVDPDTLGGGYKTTWVSGHLETRRVSS